MINPATVLLIARASRPNGLRTAASFARGGFRPASTLNFFQQERLPANTVVKFVPQQTAWIVERMGKFHRILNPGLTVLLPFIDRIAYVQSLKELAIEIPTQNAISADNVSLELDGVLYIQVVDPFKASYGVEDCRFAVSQLAQTTMRSEIGSLTLDAVLKERATLNHNINSAINDAAQAWGVRCLRYEIRDIHPPANVLEAMHRQVSAERSKRAEILESEGVRQLKINIAEGEKQSLILKSEAEKQEKINRAEAEYEAVVLKAQALSKSLDLVATTIKEKDAGKDAVNLQIAQDYIKQFGHLAKETNTMILPANLSDISSFVASGMKIYDQLGLGPGKSA